MKCKKMLILLFCLSLILCSVSVSMATTFPLEQKEEFSIITGSEIHSDPNSLIFYQRLEEETNVHIDWTNVGLDTSRTEKVKLLLNTGNYGDAIMSNVIGEDDIVSYAAAGVLVPLDPYITPEITPNIYKMFERLPQVKAANTTQDGHIYALPRVLENLPDYMESSIWINKKWLDAVGMEVPTTTQELYEVLKAFKENDCNGNGDNNDEIPLMIHNENAYCHFEAMLGMWGLPCKDSNYDSYLVVQDGVVKFVPVMDEYKDFLLYMNKLYTEGLIYQEAFTADRATVTSILEGPEPKVGMIATKYITSHADEYICIPPISAENQKAKWFYHPGFMGAKGFFEMTDKCKNPELLMSWIDKFFDPNQAFQALYGPEDVVFEKVDGKFIPLDPPEGYNFIQWQQANVLVLAGGAPGVLYSDDYGNLFELSDSQIAMKDSYVIYEEYLNKEVWPRPYLSLDQAFRLSELRTDIFNTMRRMKAQWITGGMDIESTFEQFKKDLNGMGLEEFVKLYQEAYDTFNSQLKQ